MANVSRPRGLRPVANLTGAAWTGKANLYRVNLNGAGATGGAAIGVGSVVTLTGAADDSDRGLPVVKLLPLTDLADATQAHNSAASVPVGVVVGFAIDPTVKGDTPVFRAVSTARDVYVCDDPDVFLEVQEDANGGQLAQASVGLNAGVNVVTVSTTTGLSNTELDTSTAAAGASLPLKIIAFSQRVDNEVSSSYAKVIVKFNYHAYRNTFAVTVGAAGAGI